MPWSELKLSVPNGPLRVQARGEGLPVIWTHGMFHPIEVDEQTTVGRVLGHLERCRLVRYDTRGHGRSPPARTDDAQTWARLGDELLELADALGFERFVAGGISMGAAVTLHAAVKAPQRLRGIFLLAPPTGWATRPAAMQGYRELVACGTPGRVAERVTADLKEAFPKGIPPPLLAMVGGLERAQPDALGKVLCAAAKSDLPPRTALASLEIPSVVLPWRDDSGHPMSTALEIAEALAGAKVEEVGGPDDFDEILAGMQRFLDARQ